MGQRITSGLKGIVAHASLINPDTLRESVSGSTTSLYQQAGPHAGGAAVPAGPTGSESKVLAAIEGIGDQTAPMVIEILKSGNPGLDDQAMEIGYRYASESGTQTRGWTSPGCILNAEIIHTDPIMSAATSPEGQILVVGSNGTAGFARVYDPTEETASGVTVPGAGLFSAMCATFDAEGFGFCLTQDASSVWRMYRSRGQALSMATEWDEVAFEPFDTKPSVAPDKLRLLTLPSGDWCLIEITDGGANLIVTQWASSDRGSSWTLVDTDTATFQGMGDVCVTPAGNIGMVLIDGTQSRYYSSSSPWISLFSSGTASAVSNINNTSAECWLTADPAGQLWVIIRSSSSTSSMFAFPSNDEGASWESVEQFYNLEGDTGEYITGGQAVFSGGSLCLVHKCVSAATTHDSLTRLIALGGWENCQYLYGSGGNSSLSITEGATYTPIALPGALTPWSEGGTGTLAISTGAVVITTDFAGTTHKNVTATTPPAVSAMAKATLEFKVAVGSSSTASIASPHITGKVRVSDGSTYSGLGVQLSTTAFAVVDELGNNLVTITRSMTSKTHFRISVEFGGKGTVYYRATGTNTWILAYETTTLADSGGITTGTVVWGHSQAPASGENVSTWGYVWWASHGTSLDTSPHSRMVTTAQQQALQGKRVTVNPSPLEGHTLFIRATDGPGITGELYTISPRYDHPITALFPQVSPSPRNTWRTTSSGSVYLTWDVDPTYETSLGRSIGLGLMKTNLGLVTLSGSVDGGTFTELGVWDSSVGSGLTYTLTGNVLRITGGTCPYIFRGQYVGGSVRIHTSYRKIVSHTEGIVSAASGKHVEFILDGIDGTEAASGGMALRAHSGVLVVHNVNQPYRQFRLEIFNYGTPEGYFEIGNMVLGPLITSGQQMSRGWTAQYERNASNQETRDLISRVKRLGPARKSWTWPYTDPMDQTSLRGSNPTPDYLDSASSTGEALANFRDLPYLNAGLVEELKSGEVVCIALNPIPAVSGTTVTDPTQFLYGRLASDVGVDHVLGDEGANEALRGSPLTWVEIP